VRVPLAGVRHVAALDVAHDSSLDERRAVVRCAGEVGLNRVLAIASVMGDRGRGLGEPCCWPLLVHGRPCDDRHLIRWSHRLRQGTGNRAVGLDLGVDRPAHRTRSLRFGGAG
jgi:hypothetical protein